MKLLLTCDLHRDGTKLLWFLDQAPAHDALLVAGDMLQFFSKVGLEEQSAGALRWRDTVLSAGKAFAWCSGNHDFLEGNRTPMFEASPLWMKQIPSSETFVSDGESRLLNAGAGKIAITTIPWQAHERPVIVGGKAAKFPDFVRLLLQKGSQLRTLEQVPWLVVWHEPPGGTPLSTPNAAGPEAEFVRRHLETAQADFSLHGHIHHAPTAPAGAWLWRLGKTVCFNPGQSIEGKPPQFVLLEWRGAGDWAAQWHGDGRMVGASSQNLENVLASERALMKVYLDDQRPAPEGWTLVKTPEEAIDLLKSHRVTDLSLDHDLGLNDDRTGYTVLLWIEEQCATTGFVPPAIIVHSANAGARNKMNLAVDWIAKENKEKQSG
jgi:Icc-related predicted phosphoesterase